MRHFILFLTASAMAYAGPIVYNVNRTVGAATVTGTFTTDGTLATLVTANITDWSLTMTNGSHVQQFAPGDFQRVLIIGTAVTATASDVIFNFNPGGTGCMFFQDFSGTQNNVWGVSNSNTCDGVNREHASFFSFSGGFTNTQSVNYFSPQAIATTGSSAATPEPSTVLLFGGALLGLAISSRASRRTIVSTVR